MHPKPNRMLSFMAGAFVLLSSVIVHEMIQSRGFPDGHLTDLDRAEKPLANLFGWVSVPVGLWCISLGWRAVDQPIIKAFRATVALYTVFVLLLLAVDFYYRQHLDNGGGG